MPAVRAGGLHVFDLREVWFWKRSFGLAVLGLLGSRSSSRPGRSSFSPVCSQTPPARSIAAASGERPRGRDGRCKAERISRPGQTAPGDLTATIRARVAFTDRVGIRTGIRLGLRCQVAFVCRRMAGVLPLNGAGLRVAPVLVALGLLVRDHPHSPFRWKSCVGGHEPRERSDRKNERKRARRNERVGSSR